MYVPFQPTSHIYRLFLYWEYQLGILPKGTTYQPTSPFLKEELRKLDEIAAQVDYLAKSRIETLDDLLSARETLQSEMDTLTEQRTKLQNKIRRAPPAEKERYGYDPGTLPPLLFLLSSTHTASAIFLLFLASFLHRTLSYDILVQIRYDIFNSISYVINFLSHSFRMTPLCFSVQLPDRPAILSQREFFCLHLRH